MDMTYAALTDAIEAADRSLELAIVLPTLNEKANIAPMVARLEQALGPAGWEAVFVDDNSRDGTAEEARRIGRSDPRIRVIQRIGRRGLASAAIEGMCATAAPFVAVMDADHQHDPALLLEMLAAVKSGDYDLAYASRFVAGGSAEGLSSKGREKGSKFANALARKLTGTELSDAMSGFFLLRTDQLRQQADRLSGIGFKIMLDILATAEPKLRVKEFPLKFAQRAAGESKLDHGVVLDFLAGLYERWFGRIIPTRFALFGTVGGLGVLVHMAVVGVFYKLLGTSFTWGVAIATVVAMTFNFWLNNLLTYRDQKLAGARGCFTAGSSSASPARSARWPTLLFRQHAQRHRLPLVRRRAGWRHHRLGMELCLVEQVRLGPLQIAGAP